MAALLPLLPVDVVAQDALKQEKAKGKADNAPKGPTPRTADGKVDFNGVYEPANFSNYGGALPLQPWAQKLYDDRRASLSKDDPEGDCLPAGVPRISPFPQKLVQTKDLLLILDEGNVHSYRQIFLDGRGHGKGLDNLWMGHSTGQVGWRHAHRRFRWFQRQDVAQRPRLAAYRQAACDREVHAAGPWSRERGDYAGRPGCVDEDAHLQPAVHLSPNWELLEYVCNEFNIDQDRLVGKAS